MFRAQRGFVLLLAVVAWPLTSCTTTDAVSKFCGSAASTLNSADPVFDDMGASCLREKGSRNEIGSFDPLPPSDPNCNDIVAKGDAAKAAGKVLSDYFSAVNSVASFGTAKAGTDAGDLVSKTGAAVGAGSDAQKALKGIAQFLVTAATSGYQQSQMEKEISAANKDVPTVVGALADVVQHEYIDQLLRDEEKKLGVRYKEFVAANKDHISPELRLELDDKWRADEQALVARRTSAQKLVSSLKVVSKGFADLAANADHLHAKELPALLDPYISQLQVLVPQIQKGL